MRAIYDTVGFAIGPLERQEKGYALLRAVSTDARPEKGDRTRHCAHLVLLNG